MASSSKSLIYLLATGFLCYPDSPLSKILPVNKLPGTIGSFIYLLLFLLVRVFFISPVSFELSLGFAILLTLISIYITAEALKLPVFTSKKDPKEVVIDEWAGMSFALLPCCFMANTNLIIYSLVAFALFRFFDILKPPPVSTLEKLPGAWGVVLDDVVAGVMAGGVLWGLLFFINLF